MGAASHLSLPCHESLRSQQLFVKLQYNQCIVSKQPKATHWYGFIAAFRSVDGGNGNPWRYVLPVTWKWSGPCKSLPGLAAPGRPGPAGGKAGGKRRLLPGRPWLSLGVAGCQKIATGSGGPGCQSSLRVACNAIACRLRVILGKTRRRRDRGAVYCPLSWWLWFLANNGVCSGQEAGVWEEDGI